MSIPTRHIILEVSADRLEELQAFVESVPPSTPNPVPGDRILALARHALELQRYRRERRAIVNTEGDALARAYEDPPED